MATDYRYNQFNDVLEPVTVTEVHVIPSESPYVVTLGEVPLRADPSTIVVEEIKFSLVDGTYDIGRQYTEVAETPTSLQFRPDYNTGADGDKNWNTGALLFSADNAHYTVRVTYQATGTVASARAALHPQWWFERGGGSDGDFTPTANVTISGEKNYKSVYIPADVTVTVDRTARIKCQGSFINFGTITADGKGGAGGIGAYFKEISDGDITITTAATPPEGGYTNYGGAGGGTSATAGGGKINSVWMNDWKSVVRNTGIHAFTVGAGGGSGGSNVQGTGASGGNGGGGIVITANEVYNTGTISACGAAGADAPKKNMGGGGGGCGGTIIVIARRIANGGTFTVAGGSGGTGGIGNGANGDSGQIFTWEVDIK